MEGLHSRSRLSTAIAKLWKCYCEQVRTLFWWMMPCGRPRPVRRLLGTRRLSTSWKRQKTTHSRQKDFQFMPLMSIDFLHGGAHGVINSCFTSLVSCGCNNNSGLGGFPHAFESGTAISARMRMPNFVSHLTIWRLTYLVHWRQMRKAMEKTAHWAGSDTTCGRQ